MINVRHGIGILALAFAVGTAGACSSSRASPEWHPRGSVSAPAKGKTEAKPEDRRGRRDDADGRRRGNDGKKDGKKNENRGNGKKNGHG